MMYQDIYNFIRQNKKMKIYYPLCQTYSCCLKVDFQKVDQDARGKWLIHETNAARTIGCKAWNSPAEYLSWEAICDIKGFDGTKLNPIFWKKIQVQKHPGRWAIAELQIPSIKLLFKRNTQGRKHPSITLSVIEQDTIGKSKKTKSGIRPRNPPPPKKK